jgi:hypothetical protein
LGVISVAGKWGIGVDTVTGTSIGRDLARPRLKRLAEETSGYLDQGETLVSPVAIGTRGGRAALLAGLGVLALAVAVLEVIGNRIGESGPVTGAVIAAGALALVLVLLGWVVAHKHAVVLTDRRLLVLRWRGMVIGHLRGVFIAVPRSDVATGFTSRLGWAGLRVEFAPATGMAPIRLDFWSVVDGQIARGIHHALASAAARAQGITG